ncbi:MAG: hypothetical protein AAF570_25080, partial [Bacteroidota bacterium]
MKKSLFPFLFLIMLMGSTAFAQLDHKITTGVVAYQQQDYKKAIKALSEGLADPGKLKDKNKPKGYYHRGMSYMMYMRQVAGKIQKAEDKEAAAAKYEAEMDGLVLKAYDDFKNAKATDDGKWTKKIDAQMTMLGASIMQSGLMILNGAFDQGLTPEQKNEAFKETVKYMGIAAEISPDNYIPFDLQAQAELNMKDSTAAYKNFTTASEKFTAKKPARPDLLVAYTFYRKALIERYKMKDIDKALGTLEAGLNTLEGEWARLSAKKADYPEEAWPKLQKQYDGAKNDLSNFELDMLLNSPERLQQAVDKFDKAIANEPQNYIKHVAYAQLLERVDQEKAGEVYIMATKIDPKKHIAFFNLGAMYVNQGVELYKKANEIEDNYEEAKKLQAEGDELYKKAFPYLESAAEIEPCDRETLQALM